MGVDEKQNGLKVFFKRLEALHTLLALVLATSIVIGLVYVFYKVGSE